MSSPEHRVLTRLTQLWDAVFFPRNFITEMICICATWDAQLVVRGNLTTAAKQLLAHVFKKRFHLITLICLHAPSLQQSDQMSNLKKLFFKKVFGWLSNGSRAARSALDVKEKMHLRCIFYLKKNLKKLLTVPSVSVLLVHGYGTLSKRN